MSSIMRAYSDSEKERMEELKPVNTQGWTQEKIDEANRRDRAILEEKVKAAGGISEDEAIEIARKAMEDFCNYNCFVNAVDGSICSAYSLSGDLGPYWDIDDFVWYEH